jgi:hypothetical protein
LSDTVIDTGWYPENEKPETARYRIFAGAGSMIEAMKADLSVVSTVGMSPGSMDRAALDVKYIPNFVSSYKSAAVGVS